MLTLRKLCDLVRSNLTKALPGGLHAGTEPFRELICRLPYIQTPEAGLDFVPPVHAVR
jgi:hypothetical protein